MADFNNTLLLVYGVYAFFLAFAAEKCDFIRWWVGGALSENIGIRYTMFFPFAAEKGCRKR